jgi:hypothetical protein
LAPAPALRLRLEAISDVPAATEFLRAASQPVARLHMLALHFVSDVVSLSEGGARCRAALDLAGCVAACTALTPLQLHGPWFRDVPPASAARLVARVVLHASVPRMCGLAELHVACVHAPPECPQAWDDGLAQVSTSIGNGTWAALARAGRQRAAGGGAGALAGLRHLAVVQRSPDNSSAGFAETLLHATGLTGLEWDACECDAPLNVAAAPALAQCTRLRHLRLPVCVRCGPAFPPWAHAIAALQCLTALDLSMLRGDLGLSNGGSAALAAALGRLTELQELALPLLPQDDGSILAALTLRLQRLPALTTVRLRWAPQATIDAAASACALARLPAVRSLELSVRLSDVWQL